MITRAQKLRALNFSKFHRARNAFTLVEMLVVIAIIGIVAALVLGGMSRASGAKARSRVKIELNQLVTAIDSYRQKLGFYPPDNPLNLTKVKEQGGAAVAGWAVPPLYYELTGATLESTTLTYKTLIGDESISRATVKDVFGKEGFANSSTDRDQVFNFGKNLKPNQYFELAEVPGDVELLSVPVEGPLMIKGRAKPAGANDPDPANPGTKMINPWRYVSTNPTNNPNSFDLWAEIKVGDKTEIIGNW